MKDLVTVASLQYVAEADLFKATLEDAGISAYLADDNLIAMDWMLANAVGGVKVQVAAEDAERARELIEAIDQRRRRANLKADNVVFPCEDCGKTLAFAGNRRGGVETCYHCGNYVDVPD